MSAECETGNCGARSFVVGDDGFTYCSEGHRQTQAGLVTAEDDERPQLGRRTIRKAVDEHVILTGQSGLEHYLICFQLLLWRQAHAMITHLGFPDELQALVRDLWILRLEGLRPLLAKSSNTEADTQTETFSSQVETSGSEDIKNSGERTHKGLPRIIDGLSTLYIAALFLRIPIFVQDLLRLVQDGRVPYYRALQQLDTGMKSKLDSRYYSLIDPQHMLDYDRLSTEIKIEIGKTATIHGLQSPAMNLHLCNWRLISELALPIEIFHAASKAMGMLQMDLSFDESKRATKLPRALRDPEHRLFGAILAVTKLLYPLDEKKRVPSRPIEPAAMTMDWQQWSKYFDDKVLEHKSNGGPFRKSLVTKVEDAPDMTGDQIDDYLQWYRRLFTDDEISTTIVAKRNRNLTAAMHRLFPLKQTANPATLVTTTPTPISDLEPDVRYIQQSMQSARVIAGPSRGEEDYLDRPGSDYIRWRSEDEMNSHAKTLYAQVSRISGLSIRALVASTLQVEKMMEAKFMSTS